MLLINVFNGKFRLGLVFYRMTVAENLIDLTDRSKKYTPAGLTSAPKGC